MLNVVPYVAKNMIIKKMKTTGETGFVNVRVFTALGAIPVSDAQVFIYTWSKDDGHDLIRAAVTDKNGKATLIELPVLLEQGRPIEGRTEYHLIVKASGFHTVIIVNVEVYPKITNQFNVNLTPIPMGGDDKNEKITIPIKIKNNLRR